MLIFRPLVTANPSAAHRAHMTPATSSAQLPFYTQYSSLMSHECFILSHRPIGLPHNQTIGRRRFSIVRLLFPWDVLIHSLPCMGRRMVICKCSFRTPDLLSLT